MRALDLDFVVRRRKPIGRVPLLVGSALAMAIMLLWQGQARDDLASLQSTLSRLDAEARRGAPRLVQADPGEIGRANEVLDRLALPWDRLFRAVEGASMPGVRLLGISPDAKGGIVQVSAEASGPEMMFEYVQRLVRQDELADVYLLQHQAAPGSTTHAIQFAVTASWLGHPR